MEQQRPKYWGVVDDEMLQPGHRKSCARSLPHMWYNCGGPLGQTMAEHLKAQTEDEKEKRALALGWASLVRDAITDQLMADVADAVRRWVTGHGSRGAMAAAWERGNIRAVCPNAERSSLECARPDYDEGLQLARSHALGPLLGRLNGDARHEAAKVHENAANAVAQEISKEMR